MPWRGPEFDGELPTLGFVFLDWCYDNLVVPDGPLAGEQFLMTPDQAQFWLNFYVLHPVSGRRVNRRAVLSRAKGYGKSPAMAAYAIFEALGPAVPAGWDAAGEPVGALWRDFGFKPKVQILGVSEDQTANTWDPLLDMIRNGPLADEPGVEALETFVNVPRGRIEAVTSSATSREGFRPVAAVFDQTEAWIQSNGGLRLAAAVRRNLTKTDGSSIETPNAFRPGQDSVAEASHKAWLLQQEGKLRNETGIYFDHREMPPDIDITDRDSLWNGLRYAYGCSADAPCALAERGDHPAHEPGWVNLDRVIADFWDPATDPSDARMYFGNQITSASDAWVSAQEWLACGPQRGDEPRVIDRREPIVLGFDGSRSRVRGKADATALMAVTVRDGYAFDEPSWTWEQPDGAPDWEVPAVEVDATVRECFKRFNVVGFYADPARWESYVADWESVFGAKLKVKASVRHPISWWMTGMRGVVVAKAIAQSHTAIINGEMAHNGSSALTRHVLNARVKIRGDQKHLGKEFPDSVNKIDKAVALVMAWQARTDAVAAGLAEVKKRQAPRRIY
jgi:hypothetical protein